MSDDENIIELIQFPGYFTGFGSRSDGSASLRFATQELADADFAALKRNLNEFGWILFRPNQFTEEDIPKDDAPRKTRGGRSQSQTLRSVLFLIWERKPSPKDSFDHFYRSEMAVIIESYKEQL
jgi:hypothetical protein